MSATLLISIVSLGVGAIGAALGILNYLRALDRDKVKLRVVPTWLIDSEGRFYAIEVLNLSQFAVSIAEVGFSVGVLRKRYRFAVQPTAKFFQGQIVPLSPQKLEPREAVKFFLPAEVIASAHMGRARRAYCRTECEEFAFGSSGSLRSIRKAARQTSAAATVRYHK
jgi:hypothetical protein